MTATILVPLDGSELAESALQLEATLARLTSSGIALLCAVPTSTPLPSSTTGEHPTGMFTGDGTLPKTAERRTKDGDLLAAQAYLDTIGKRLVGVGLQVRTEIVRDLPAAAIAEYAEQNPSIWLIAMTTAHEDASRRWGFGSVVEKVLHATHKPVLLIRPLANASPNNDEGLDNPGEESEEQTSAEVALRTILVPLDGSSFAEEALEQARQIALLTGATLVLACAIPPPGNGDIDQAEFVRISIDIARGNETARLTRYLSDTAEQLRAQGLEVLTELVFGHPAEMILLAADRLSCDLIVVAAQGRRDLERLWLGSVAQKLMQFSTLPVLLMRTSAPHLVTPEVTSLLSQQP